MGKSKKRNRTKALYDAAAASKRRMLQAKHEKNGDNAAEIDAFTSGNHETQSKKEPMESLLQVGSPTPSVTLEAQPTPSDIATTLRTIRHLAKFPDTFLHSKEYKELRGALHPLITERLKFYDKGIDYRQRVTLHLSHRRWSPALSSLSAAKDFQQIPKQGTVQRWVRDVDLCEDGPIKIQLLTAILSCKNKYPSNTNNDVNGGDGMDSSTRNGENEDEHSKAEIEVTDHTNKHDPAVALLEAQKNYKKSKTGSNSEKTGVELLDTSENTEMKVLKGWRIPSYSSQDNNNNNNDKNNDDLDFQDLKTLESRIVYREAASERIPPNHYDLMLHATEPFAVLPLRGRKISGEVTKHEVPFLKRAFCLANVLSHDECSRLVDAASILGYRPDHPSNLPSPTGIDSCEWLVDDSIHDLVYDRVKKHLPLSMGEASSNDINDANKNNKSNSSNINALCGINKRWRFFRYGQDCVYRPHIDGSWPAGSLAEDGKSYQIDKSGSTRSYLTFLIYLNDGFEGGETRFFYPDETGANTLVARGIIPKMGSVLVFPQGNTASLLHEGSAVTTGEKYVVRTDVLYKHN